MSHFTVLVPAKDRKSLAALLQPYHEFECTGENDQYVQEVDVTQEVLEKGADYYGLGESVTSEAEIDRDGDHKYGYVLVNEHGQVLKAINRTNPNNKWDWWTVGGRWKGLLSLKAGSQADYARIKEIDFDAMRRKEADTEVARWDAFQAAWETVKDLKVKRVSKEERAKWNANEYLQCAFPDIRDWQRWETVETHDNDLLDWLDLTEIAQLRTLTRADYYQHHYDSALTYAYLDTQGQWHGRGDMGWWGMDSNRRDEYDQEFWGMVEALDPETFVFIVDCHI